MSKIRIYELARELGIENKELIACAQRLGMPDKSSHSNSLEDYEADALRRAFIRDAVSTSSSGSVANQGGRSINVVKTSQTILRSTSQNSAVYTSTPKTTSQASEIRRPGVVVRRRRSPEEEELQDSSVAFSSDESTAQGNLLEHEVVVAESEESSLTVDSSSLSDHVPTSSAEILETHEKQGEPQVAYVPQERREHKPKVLGMVSLSPSNSMGSNASILQQAKTSGEQGLVSQSTTFNPSSAQTQLSSSEAETNSSLTNEGSQSGVIEKESYTRREPVANTTILREDRNALDHQEGELEVEASMFHSTALPNTYAQPKSSGPKVLGKISLPIRKSLNREDLDEDDELLGGKVEKKVRAKKRELSRKDLVDYELETKKSKTLVGDQKKRLLKKLYKEEDASPAKHEFTGPKASKKVIKIDEFITVGQLAGQMSLKSGEIITKLIGLGIMATINQPIDKDTAAIVADEFGFQIESIGFDETEFFVPESTDTVESLKQRPPVVTVMGHVDHGKTSLLDKIREASVADREHGGITQHIGAYQVALEDGRKVTFIDTPGHEAFTTMRARGAQVTDIIILVVAGDDGVMPQTIEAINHSKAAQVPIIVAVNKMDKPESNVERVKQQLLEHGLQPEEWGGDTLYFPVSAFSGLGIQELLEGVLLLAEIKECKANPDTTARGTVIEASQRKGRGTVATVLVQRGTLKLGDIFVAGACYGRVRSMSDDKLNVLEIADPSCPVEITGFNGNPSSGDDFIVVESEVVARQIAENRSEKVAIAERARGAIPMTLEEFAKRATDSEIRDLNVILKADVHGSVEAVKQSLERLSGPKVRVRVIHSGIGGVTESDVQLAVASSSVVLGFGVRGEPRALDDAESQGIDVRFYRVIYELLDDIQKAMVGLLDPDKEEVYLGRAEVRNTFVVPKIGTIAGCYVVDGTIKRGGLIRVLRDSAIVYQGKMGSLRRFKEDVKQVQSGYECGIGVENFNDVKVGDVLEAFEIKEVTPTLN
jgi:translation initiation factor IF-2